MTVIDDAIPPPPPPPPPGQNGASQMSLLELARQRAAQRLLEGKDRRPPRSKRQVVGVHIDRPRWVVILTASTVAAALIVVPVMISQRSTSRALNALRDETADNIVQAQDDAYGRFAADFRAWQESSDPGKGLLPIIDARVAEGPKTIIKDDPFVFAAPMGLKLNATARVLIGDGKGGLDPARATEASNQALRLIGGGAKPETLTIAQDQAGKVKVSAAGAGEAALFAKIGAAE